MSLTKLTADQLTYGERWFIARRRRGLTQDAMAALHDMSVRVYNDVERGRMIPVGSDPTVNSLTDVEQCVLLRRRTPRMTQARLARRVGVSRYWLHAMETGKANPARLVEYWTNNEAD